MRKAWKKALSAVLTASMLFSLMPTVVLAEGCTHECSVENGCIVVDCQHEHDDDCWTSTLICEEDHEHEDSCYAAELSCGHVCSADSGCVTVDCLHTECDEACGGLDAENLSTGGGTKYPF